MVALSLELFCGEAGRGATGVVSVSSVGEPLESRDPHILLIHGGRDTRIPPSSSRQAKQLFKLAEVRLLPDADHSFRDIRRERLFSTTINWLRSFSPKVPADSRPQVKAEIEPQGCELVHQQ